MVSSDEPGASSMAVIRMFTLLRAAFVSAHQVQAMTLCIAHGCPFVATRARTRTHARQSMLLVPLLFAVSAPATTPAVNAPAAASRHAGICDASAGVALDARRFVVADDERNTLVIYRTGSPAAVERIDLSVFLGTRQDKESDIEGAAQVGQRIYWIASHGLNARGEFQERRHRFFATDVVPGNAASVQPAGRPYTQLLRDLQRAPSLAHLDLARAGGLAPEAPGGLNIEGLAAAPDGSLLIGFRNPLRQARALLVPLLNPDDLLQGRAARFGMAIELDLGGRGIRSIERVGARYLIVAGPTGDAGAFALFSWSGRATDRPVASTMSAFGDLRPEALFALKTSGELRALSDDGGRMIEGKRCKDLPSVRQEFRDTTVRP